MDASGTLEVQEVLDATQAGIVCIVRCVAGIVRPEDRAGVSPTIDNPAEAPVRISAIWFPAKRAVLLNPPLSARVEFVGNIGGDVRSGQWLYTFEP